MRASLNSQLEEVEWGEFTVGELFEVRTSRRRFDANKVDIGEKGHPYVVRTSVNNGHRGLIDEDPELLNPGNTLSFGQDTATIFYQEQPYFTGDKIKVLVPRDSRFGKNNAQFVIAAMNKTFSAFSWGASRFNVSTLENQTVYLPAINGSVNYDFINRYIAELEAEHLVELEAYLKATGLDDAVFTDEDREVLACLSDVEWSDFTLLDLYGASTRGRRLKSLDRVPGTLPFVTAGEADEGVSAFIGNSVEIFKPHTVTIDMFGSAKYRCYQYGADDHIAVVHTEDVPVDAVPFVATSIHKASYNGQFSYSRNFYPKDADVLTIKLPVKDRQPDYAFAAKITRAVRKLVIADVVNFADRRIEATRNIVAER